MTMAINIQPVEAEGAFWVDVTMDSQPMRRHGPYSADEAEAAATRIAAMCRAMHFGVHFAPAAARKR